MIDTLIYYTIILIYVTKHLAQPLLEKLHICLLNCVRKFIQVHSCIIYPRLTFSEH